MPGYSGQGFTADQRGSALGQLPLGMAGEKLVELGRYSEFQDSVA
jgi:hypothetical protein